MTAENTMKQVGSLQQSLMTRGRGDLASSCGSRFPRARSVHDFIGVAVMAIIAAILTATSAIAQSGGPEPLPTPSYYQSVHPEEPRVIRCDVAVYGGTPAGVTAAIQAARMGKEAVMLSFNQHVGGMTSGGLTATDLGRKESIGGLALEFYDRIGRKSGFRPSNVESFYRKMLDEAGVNVLFGRALKSVEMKDNLVLFAFMETGETIHAGMFVDATYEGDLFAAAHVSYRVGREPVGA